MQVLGTVDPGLSTWRGKLLNILGSTLLHISRDDYALGILPDITFKRRLYTCIKTLASN